MAKQTAGILGGFNGKVGPVIGYVWRGRWCMRARPRKVHNPRTEAQQAHRMQFRDMVQTASQLTAALRYGMRQASLEQGLTEGNLFVRMNKDCFSAEGVDYTRLLLSSGPLAPVAFAPATVDERGVMRVEFEKNPLRLRASSEDKVWVVAYCPELKQLVIASPVERRVRRVATALPDEWAGREFHVWGFVTDYKQRASECQYIALAEIGEGQAAGLGTEGGGRAAGLVAGGRERTEGLAEIGEEQNKAYTKHDGYETFDDISDGNGGLRGGVGAAGDGLGLAGRREDGDADTRGRGAGGAGADDGRR